MINMTGFIDKLLLKTKGNSKEKWGLPLPSAEEVERHQKFFFDEYKVCASWSPLTVCPTHILTYKRVCTPFTYTLANIHTYMHMHAHEHTRTRTNTGTHSDAQTTLTPQQNSKVMSEIDCFVCSSFCPLYLSFRRPVLALNTATPVSSLSLPAHSLTYSRYFPFQFFLSHS